MTLVVCDTPASSALITEAGESVPIHVPSGSFFNISLIARDSKGRLFSNCTALETEWESSNTKSVRFVRIVKAKDGTCATAQFEALVDGTSYLNATAEVTSTAPLKVIVYSPFDIIRISPPVMPLPITASTPIVLGLNSQAILTISGGSSDQLHLQVVGSPILTVEILESTLHHLVRITCETVGDQIVEMSVDAAPSVPGLSVRVSCVIPVGMFILPVAWNIVEGEDRAWTALSASSQWVDTPNPAL